MHSGILRFLSSVGKMSNTSWTSFFRYTDTYNTNVISRVDQMAQSKDVNYKDFNQIDLIHPSGHQGLSKFMSAYTPAVSSKTLEVGVGAGGTSRYLHFEHGLSIFGLDYMSNLVQISNRINQILGVSDKISHVQGDICAYPLEENSFDLGLSIGVFNHIDSNRGLENTMESLKPGGLLYLEDLYQARPVTPEDLPVIKSRGYFGLKTPEELFRILESCGMEIIEREEWGPTWSEDTWRVINSLVKAKKEGNSSLHEEHLKEYVYVSSTQFCHLSHLSLSEIQNRYPDLCELINVSEIVFERPPLISIHRLVARKL